MISQVSFNMFSMFILDIVRKTTINWTPDTFSDVEYKTRVAMIEAIAMEYI